MSSIDSHPATRTLAGRFLVGARRGSGLEVATFDGVDQETDEPVVLKLIHPTICEDKPFRLRFSEIMAQVADVHHPNLARVLHHGADIWNGRPMLFVASEHLGGGSLRDLLDRGRVLSASQALMVGLEACKGLDALHRAGQLHGDIRPAHLIFGDDSRLRISDSGLSRVISELVWSDGSQPTMERATYASPERALGEEIGPESDVYSLALTVVEAATGKVPFTGDSAVSTLANRVDRLLPVNADLGALAAVLERAARPHADDRYSAAGFGAALLQAAQKLPRPAPIPTLSGGLFAERTTASDPTGPLARAGEPTPARGMPREPQAIQRPDQADLPAEPEAAESPPADPGPADPVQAEPPVDEPAPTEPVADEPAPPEPPASEEPAAAVTEPPATMAVVEPPAAVTPPPRRPQPAGVPPIVRTAEPTAGRSAATPTVHDVAPSPAVAAAPPPAPQVAPSPPAGSPPLPATPAAQPVPMRGWRATRAQAREAAQAATPAEPVAVFDQGRRRSLWWITLPLLLLVAAGGGLAWYLKIRSSEHRLPALAGMTETEARALLKPLDFTLELTPAPDEQIPAGKIVSTDPAEGVTLREGDTVKAIISSGPAPRRVPSLIGMTVAAATDELDADGLVPQRDADVFDEQVAAGSVVSFSVDGQPAAKAGDDVARGSVIRLVVSKGPKPRKAPQLRGLSTADATTVLDQLDLVLDITSEAFSPDVVKGSIISQTPAANADVPRGASVSVVVSKGPEMVAVPDVGGLTAAGIVNAVRTAGLAVDLAASSGDFTGQLTSMTFEGKALKAGDLLPRGTKVVLNFD